MIDAQKKALAIARQSREDALKATKVKSFTHLRIGVDTDKTDKKQLLGIHVPRVGYSGHYPLCATNSVHPNGIGCERRSGVWLKTPPGLPLILLSSFYGLLDILSGTELNPGQRETGKMSPYATHRALNALQCKRLRSPVSSY